MAPGNALFFNHMLYDLVRTLWREAGREGLQELPVPDRQAHEHGLMAHGFDIAGDVATRRRQGLFATLLGKLAAERRMLPNQGNSDDYVALASEALTMIPGWPAARAQVLRSCLHTHIAMQTRAVTPEEAIPYCPPPRPPPPRQQTAGEVPAWMEDFITGHAAGKAAPVLTSPHLRATSHPSDRTQPSGKPDWMQDFET